MFQAKECPKCTVAMDNDNMEDFVKCRQSGTCLTIVKKPRKPKQTRAEKLAYKREYNSRPKVRQRQKEYREIYDKFPEVIAYNKKRNRVYRQKPEIKARYREAYIKKKDPDSKTYNVDRKPVLNTQGTRITGHYYDEDNKKIRKESRYGKRKTKEQAIEIISEWLRESGNPNFITQ